MWTESVYLLSFFIDSTVINQCWESLPSFVFISQTSFAVTTHTHTSLHHSLDLSPTDRDFLSVAASFSPPIKSKKTPNYFIQNRRKVKLRLQDFVLGGDWSCCRDGMERFNNRINRPTPVKSMASVTVRDPIITSTKDVIFLPLPSFVSLFVC